jgi:predicted nucleic acid-binding protein
MVSLETGTFVPKLHSLTSAFNFLRQVVYLINSVLGLFRLVADGIVQLAYEYRLLSEYRDILNRPRFNLPKEAVETFLVQVEQEGFLVSAKPLKFSGCADPGDEPFLEAALSARVAGMVTGNKCRFPRRIMREQEYYPAQNS